MAKVNVKQDPEKEVPTEILAQAIIDIAGGMKRLRSGRLNDRALTILIQAAVTPNLTLSNIRAVLDGIQDLERQFIRKKV